MSAPRSRFKKVFDMQKNTIVETSSILQCQKSSTQKDKHKAQKLLFPLLDTVETPSGSAENLKKFWEKCLRYVAR